jgi:ATP diphosphatase
MRPYLLEELYEVLDAIDRGEMGSLKGELGDLLFQIVLLAQMASEAEDFTITQVIEAVNAKMILRHPHVFDPSHDATANEGSLSAWEARKARERDAKSSALDGVPDALPALLRAHRISEKASVVGFDWPDRAGVLRKLAEELGELDEALLADDPDMLEEELGDVLFTLVNLGRHLPVGAEDSLRVATARFERRFRALEQALEREGRTVHDTPPDVLEKRWRDMKGA